MVVRISGKQVFLAKNRLYLLTFTPTFQQTYYLQGFPLDNTILSFIFARQLKISN